MKPPLVVFDLSPLPLYLYFHFFYLFSFGYGFGNWVSLKMGVWISGCGNLEALVAFSFGSYGFWDLVVAFNYGGCGLCLNRRVLTWFRWCWREKGMERQREISVDL